MLKLGTQIAYVPLHAEDRFHPDVEYGFVTSVKESFAFCRYWRKFEPGVLRTTANSEATPKDQLIEIDSVPEGVIIGHLKRLGYM